MTRLETINNILMEEDIEGYIDLGAPADEYSSEAKSLNTALKGVQDISTDLVYGTLHDIWQRSFNLSEEDMELRDANLLNTSNRISSEIAL